MKTDLFQSCGHYWVFQICWHIECSTFTASSFRIWNSSTGIPSPPLALLQDPTDFTVHGILQARILEWVAFPSPGDLPNTGIEPRSPTLQVDSLPAEPQGKPKNTGVGIKPGSPALQADSLPTELSGKAYQTYDLQILFFHLVGCLYSFLQLNNALLYGICVCTCVHTPNNSYWTLIMGPLPS